MALAVEKDESMNPADVLQLCSIAVMLQPDALAHQVKQAWCGVRAGMLPEV